MRLYQRKDIREGEKFPEAWITKGKFEGRGWYFSFALCLPNLKTERMFGFIGAARTGWFVPRIHLSVDPHFPSQIRIGWFWEYLGHFMGEEWIEKYDHFGNLLNCPRCNGHFLTQRYEAVGIVKEGTMYEPTIICERCKHKYPAPGTEPFCA